MREVVLINRTRGVVYLDDDTCLPIDGWLDSDGEPCEAGDAVVGIAGEDGIGWFAFILSAYEPVIAH